MWRSHTFKNAAFKMEYGGYHLTQPKPMVQTLEGGLIGDSHMQLSHYNSITNKRLAITFRNINDMYVTPLSLKGSS
jgi:hypothetical protein